jgi:hypothetical protein
MRGFLLNQSPRILSRQDHHLGILEKPPSSRFETLRHKATSALDWAVNGAGVDQPLQKGIGGCEPAGFVRVPCVGVELCNVAMSSAIWASDTVNLSR